MIFRVEKTKNYTVMSNYHLKEKDMSWKAKGLLSTMLSLPEDWDFSVEGLASLSSDGITATSTALQELEKFGYLKRNRVYKNGKISDIEYTVYEQPQNGLKCENLILGNQTLENQAQLNTKENKILKESSTNKEVATSTISVTKKSGRYVEKKDTLFQIEEDRPKLKTTALDRALLEVKNQLSYLPDTIQTCLDNYLSMRDSQRGPKYSISKDRVQQILDDVKLQAETLTTAQMEQCIRTSTENKWGKIVWEDKSSFKKSNIHDIDRQVAVKAREEDRARDNNGNLISF